MRSTAFFLLFFLAAGADFGQGTGSQISETPAQKTDLWLTSVDEFSEFPRRHPSASGLFQGNHPLSGRL